jgi:hypothetical protein
VEGIDIWMDFVVGNSNKLQKLGLEGKVSWALNVFTLPNLDIFNLENVKNKIYVHTWANDTGYTNLCIKLTINNSDNETTTRLTRKMLKFVIRWSKKWGLIIKEKHNFGWK